MNTHGGGWALRMDAIAGIRYSAGAADDAWTRILAFLARHLEADTREAGPTHDPDNTASGPPWGPSTHPWG
jgi:hypothetical protein